MGSAPHAPPFRAEHLGSLLRPERLLKKRHAIQQKKESDDGLQALTDECIQEAVRMQRDCGFRAITDGEYPRHMFWGTFFPSLNGMKEIYGPEASIFREYVPDIAAFLEEDKIPGESIICVGKISHTGQSSYIGQYEYLKSITPNDLHGKIKMTLAAPNWYHLRYKEGKAYPKDVYATDEEYFADIAKAYRTELKILYDAGLRNVQVDDPNLACKNHHILMAMFVANNYIKDFCSEKMISGWKEDPSNTRTVDDLFDAYIAFYNNCFKRPADMHLGIHLCRGNFVGSRHFSEGGYDRIATKLFNELDVSTYYLEYDTARAGGFEPLKELPKNKNVILGVVTSKFPELEDKEHLKARVYQAAEIVASDGGESREQALKRLGVSPQCGFASHEDGNLLGYEDMVRKLKLVRQVADEVWPGEA